MCVATLFIFTCYWNFWLKFEIYVHTCNCNYFIILQSAFKHIKSPWHNTATAGQVANLYNAQNPRFRNSHVRHVWSCCARPRGHHWTWASASGCTEIYTNELKESTQNLSDNWYSSKLNTTSSAQSQFNDSKRRKFSGQSLQNIAAKKLEKEEIKNELL